MAIIDGFNIDLSSVVYEGNELEKLKAFDVFFGKTLVSHFEKPEGDFALVSSNQNVLNWKHSVPSWVIEVMSDYKDVTSYADPENALKPGFNTLLCNLVQIIEIDTIYSILKDQGAKMVYYGFGSNRDLQFIASENDQEAINLNQRDDFKLREATVLKARELFHKTTGGHWAGVRADSVIRTLNISADLKREVALILKFKRIENNYTLKDVSAMLAKNGVDLAPASINRFENNQRHPDLNTLKSLIKVLGLSSDEVRLSWFEDDVFEDIDTEEFGDSEFPLIDLSDVVLNNAELSQDAKTLLSVLFNTFFLGLDYRDNSWLKASVLPSKTQLVISNPKEALRALEEAGLVKVKKIRGSKFISLSIDAFIAEKVDAIIKENKKA
jgi:hypothetical protein